MPISPRYLRYFDDKEAVFKGDVTPEERKEIMVYLRHRLLRIFLKWLLVPCVALGIWFCYGHPWSWAIGAAVIGVVFYITLKTVNLFFRILRKVKKIWREEGEEEKRKNSL